MVHPRAYIKEHCTNVVFTKYDAKQAAIAGQPLYCHCVARTSGAYQGVKK
jgi:hypothetical protein